MKSEKEIFLHLLEECGTDVRVVEDNENYDVYVVDIENINGAVSYKELDLKDINTMVRWLYYKSYETEATNNYYLNFYCDSFTVRMAYLSDFIKHLSVI